MPSLKLRSKLLPMSSPLPLTDQAPLTRFTNSRANRACSETSSHRPPSIAAFVANHDPPKASTDSSLKYDSALVAPKPPNGINLTPKCANGAPIARRYANPPLSSAGKNFITLHPCSNASSISVGVHTPGANESPASRAAVTTRGFIPGATPNAAPAALASRTCSTVRIVPAPTIISGTSARIRRKASIATGVRSVNSTQSTPPASNALATGTAASTDSKINTANTPLASNRLTKDSSNMPATMNRIPLHTSPEHFKRRGGR